MPRPPKPKSDQRSSMIWVRMTPKEQKLVETAAQKDGLPTSTWARVIILRAATRGGLSGDSE